jgi:hypothetical protein
MPIRATGTFLRLASTNPALAIFGMLVVRTALLQTQDSRGIASASKGAAVRMRPGALLISK